MTLPPDSAAYVEQLGELVPLLSRLPCADYAEIIAESALALRSDATSARMLALLIAAVGEQESRWGLALRDGCGDWTLRTGHWLVEEHTIRVSAPPRGSHWLYPRRDGAIVPGPYCMPDDGLGWGRGLMQLDFKNALGIDWRDPATNVKRGAQILDAGLRTFPGNMEAGVASYNAGPSTVRHALSLGHHPDSVTTGGDYASRVLGHFRAWGGA